MSSTSRRRAGRRTPQTWTCECGTHNFSDRVNCYRCDKIRTGPPRGEQNSAASQGAGRVPSPTDTRQPQDWATQAPEAALPGPCGRRVFRAGWGRATCFQPAGHPGACR